MATISAARFLTELERWNVTVVQHTRGGTPWYQHGRNHRPWHANGICIHHTGGPTSWQFVWDGRADVPGPLYTVEIYPDGTAHLTGWGVTNNVGSSSATVVSRVRAGNMPTSGGNVRPGVDNYADANEHFYGIAYRGTAPNQQQRDTALRVCAAICTAHNDVEGWGGWGGGSVAGHKELTRRKPDPRGENMSTFRRDLNELLATEGEDSMADIMVSSPSGEDEWTLPHGVSWIMHRLWEMQNLPYGPSDDEQNWSLPHMTAWTARRVYELHNKVEALLAAISAISENTDISAEEVKQAVAEALRENVVSVDIDVEGNVS